MKFQLNRTCRIECFLNPVLAKKESNVDSFLDKFGFVHIDPLDIEDFEKIPWEGIEFNRLYYSKNNKGILPAVYRFNKWIGEYPFDGVELQEIGYIFM